MTSAGVGVAVHLDGFTAAGLAAHRALAAAGTRTAKVAIVFAGIKHDDDEYAGVLSAVRRTLPDAAVIGCSATGVLTGAEEVENANAVVVQVLDGDGPLPTPLFLPGVRGEPRAAGAKLGQRARDALDGEVEGAAVAVLVDPAELDAADFVAGIADAAPGLLITGAGASGGEAGCRVFWEDSAHADSAVALVLPRALHPSLGMTQGCQALGDPLTITAADGNLILEIEGRPAVEALDRTLSDPRHPGLRQMTAHLLAGIGERGSGGRSNYVVRPFAVAEGERAALAVAEPVRTGQTICFTLRDAIGARDDMKAMLDEQAEARGADTPKFGFYFNCAGRGSALYGQPGLDPELIRRRFGALSLAGIESSFEIAPTFGRPRIHMFTGVLLLAG
ncbi:MAG TPA: FIST N-terminal domain-containing protein [Polyangia bacterium]|nr:FIST N-terminal domain-containing protein [Polyangia bacterium]